MILNSIKLALHIIRAYRFLPCGPSLLWRAACWFRSFTWLCSNSITRSGQPPWQDSSSFSVLSHMISIDRFLTCPLCRWTDNALLTQSHYMLMEPILLFFAMTGVLCVLKFRALERSGNAQAHSYSFRWWGWLLSGAIFLTCALWYSIF